MLKYHRLKWVVEIKYSLALKFLNEAELGILSANFSTRLSSTKLSRYRDFSGLTKASPSKGEPGPVSQSQEPLGVQKYWAVSGVPGFSVIVIPYSSSSTKYWVSCCPYCCCSSKCGWRSLNLLTSFASLSILIIECVILPRNCF